MLLELLGALKLLDAEGVDERQDIETEVARISELATDGQVLQDGVGGVLVVKSDGGGLEVLDEFAGAEHLSRQAELLLDGVPGGNDGFGVVGAEEIPRVESGKVLQRSQDLVTTDCAS